MKAKISLILCLAVILGLFSGCKADTVAEKPVIAVTIIPEATFLSTVAGDDFEIITMIPAGASPETYEPSPKEKAALENAAIYFSIGVPSEESILKSLSLGTKIVALHEKTAEKYPDLTIDGGRDPHIWLCPERASLMVSLIAEELALFFPENAQKYNQNAQDYINEISSAAQTARNVLENNETKDFFVFHPSFQYLANFFSLNMYALEENGKEANPKYLAQMVDLAKEKNIKAVFYQAEASARQAESFAKEIGGKAVKLEPLSPDYTKNIIKMATAIAGE